MPQKVKPSERFVFDAWIIYLNSFKRIETESRNRKEKRNRQESKKQKSAMEEIGNSLADDFIICGYSNDVDYEDGDIGYKALAYAQGFVSSAGVPKLKPVLEQFDQLGKTDLQIIPEQVKTLAREVVEAANGNNGIPLKLKLSLDLCKYICHI